MAVDSLAAGWAKALSVDKKQFNLFFEKMMEGFAYHRIVVDKSGKPIDYVFLEVNDAFEKMTGLRKRKIIGKKATAVLTGIEKDPANWIGVYGRVALTGEPVQFENYAEPLGKWYNVSAYCPEKNYFVALFEDITVRKKAEEALKKAREQTELDTKRLETILKTTPSAVVIIEAKNGKFTYVNKRAMQLYGFDTLGLNLDENVAKVKARRADGTDYPIPEMPVSRSLSLGQEVRNEEMIIERADGKVLPIIVSTAPLRDKQGHITAAIVVFEDITERKKAEEAFRESEERLRFHAENIPLAVVEWDSRFVVTRWAGDAEKMFGWTGAETIGKPIMDLSIIYEPDIPIVEKTMNRLTSGETKVVSSNRNITKDGRVIYCTWYNSVLLDAEGKMTSVFSFVEDNTAKVKAEKELEENNKNLEKVVEERTRQLKDSERLAAIGATAGMVGHDIRNPLQGMTSDVYLAKTELASMPESQEKKNVLESLEEIEKNIDYVNKIVADLQDYARTLKPIARETNLPKLIEELLVKSYLPKGIKVQVKIQKEAEMVLADSDILKRILGNLITNAVQAMPNGGKLSIQTCKEADDSVITVADTGVGIPEEAREKLFTPLFTTKSKGQGFGLAVVKRMVESLGGTVSFESQEGKGTRFILCFPPKTA